MQEIGLLFSKTDEVHLSVVSATLTIDFKGSSIDRLIVFEPALQSVMPGIVTDYAAQKLGWNDLRRVLRNRGVDTCGLEAANPRPPKNIVR